MVRESNLLVPADRAAARGSISRVQFCEFYFRRVDRIGESA
jgi:hypothetical protein